MREIVDSDFLFVTGMVRSMENSLLSRSTLESLLRSVSFADAVNILSSTRYSSFADPGIEPFSAGMLITSARAELFDFIDRYSRDSGAAYLFRLDYDYHNMKMLLMRKLYQDERPGVLSDFGNVSSEDMNLIFAEEDYNRLPPVMREAVSNAIEEYFGLKKYYIINLIFDRYLFLDMLGSAAATGSALIKNFIQRRIDAVNIMALLRVRERRDIENYREYLFIDGGSIDAEFFRRGLSEPSRALSDAAMLFDLNSVVSALSEKSNMVYAVERACRGLVMNELVPADCMISGVEPLFAYCCRVDNELRNIGMILSSKVPGFSREIVETLFQYGGEQ